MLIGDAGSPPTLKATANFAGFGLIDGNPYYTSDLNWVSVNNFYRQIRNLVIDTTNVAPGTACTGIHWPTSQATSLQNVKFNMPTASGVVHVGLFIGMFIMGILFSQDSSLACSTVALTLCRGQNPEVVVSCPISPSMVVRRVLPWGTSSTPCGTWSSTIVSPPSSCCGIGTGPFRA